MEYKKFKEGIRERMQEELGEGTEISFHELQRNNGIMEEGLEVREKGSAAAPVLHLKELYGGCCGNGGMGEAVSRALKMLEEKPAAPIETVPQTWEAARAGIRAVLVHYGWNRESLSGIPHRKFLNLAVTYRVEIPPSVGFQAGIRINSGLMELWGVTEEGLYQAAMDNLRNEGYSVQTMAELLGGVTGTELELPEDAPEQYVLANTGGFYGAAGMLREDILESFARQAGGDFYILPSSIHELVLVPETPTINAECLKEMVKEVNGAAVAREEWLSEDVYYYDSDERKVKMIV